MSASGSGSRTGTASRRGQYVFSPQIMRHPAVFEQQADGEDAGVGVRMEGPVLVPLEARAAAVGLHVQLRAVHADVRPQQLFENAKKRLARAKRAEDRMVLVGMLDAAKARIGRGVIGLDVVDVVVLRDRRRLGDEVRERAAHRDEGRLVDCVFD